MYEQVFDPVSNSLGWSSIFAALPLITLFVMLGAFRITAWISGLVSLAWPSWCRSPSTTCPSGSRWTWAPRAPRSASSRSSGS